ncbi:50S ribosomal protein L6 [Candidatus Woesearchaeota archaeon CG_4_10_14_0_2_um_filter_33_13]|nr:MAG: 50S ribosomal protein L6 [Candidatus Woesearchaeota archaeon CG_4_10_14_0_2_um_filter_33_13]
MKIDLREEIELPNGVTAVVDPITKVVKIKGSKEEIDRAFLHPKVKINLEGNKIILVAEKATKREKTMLGSYYAHINNMIKGVQEPHTYKLKICSGHFPMNVAVSGTEFVIKNFLGESVPRKFKIVPGVDIKVNGTEIVVKSADKEKAGMMAAKIELLCRITNRDIRIFQDGCYITHKAGKDMI